ncbi:hypothetical protein [Streptomyces griseoloalbus]|uniref:Uncharacterized protein n=1 Tax=Streptomyces griseoloalbus TaxID=67303 RepID=A0A7W8BRS4_9ACTN|nr:hypothetical protein [Streptomyces albaduncus]MBB5128235.1 hypothetical protein [Streptomyces albaduncus]GGV82796.1 hypothetical protein GCM10010294_58430 [Streptomyces griseoloalbus]GGW54162.1 hypothetical protein GCM10010340_35890 [Streptomyces albaduncus]
MTSAFSVADRNREIVRTVCEVADSAALDEPGAYLTDGCTLTRAAAALRPVSGPEPAPTTTLSRLFPMAGTRCVTVRQLVADRPNRVLGLVDTPIA